jgi:hypothetical protein
MKLPQLRNEPQSETIETGSGTFSLLLRAPTLRELETAFASDVRWYTVGNAKEHADAMLDRLSWLAVGWSGVEGDEGNPVPFKLETLMAWMASDGTCRESVQAAVQRKFEENLLSKKSVTQSPSDSESGPAAKES